MSWVKSQCTVFIYYSIFSVNEKVSELNSILVHYRLFCTNILWKINLNPNEERTDGILPVLMFAAIDYIHFLHKEKKKQEEEVSVLRKEVMALKIMKT